MYTANLVFVSWPGVDDDNFTWESCFSLEVWDWMLLRFSDLP